LFGGDMMNLANKDSAYLRNNIDLLFIALNPPKQSNSNGHYFSGKQSLFFKQLFESGLITANLSKSKADEAVFGASNFNYKNSQYGVVDLVPYRVETDSNSVRVTKENVSLLLGKIRVYNPKNVCIIHSKVRAEIEKEIGIRISYGANGKLLDNCETVFYCNYFPNGNNIPTAEKLRIYRLIKDKL
jgi:G:T/U-mismatch repair DNA glycosylase